MPAAGWQRRHLTDVAAPGRPAHHPGITPGGVICGDRENSPMSQCARMADRRVPASTLIPYHRRRRPGIILPGAMISPVIKPTSTTGGSRECGGTVLWPGGPVAAAALAW